MLKDVCSRFINKMTRPIKKGIVSSFISIWESWPGKGRDFCADPYKTMRPGLVEGLEISVGIWESTEGAALDTA